MRSDHFPFSIDGLSCIEFRGLDTIPCLATARVRHLYLADLPHATPTFKAGSMTADAADSGAAFS